MQNKETQNRKHGLWLTNSLPEKWFIEQHGEELFEKLRKEAFIIDRGICAGCEHEPAKDKKKFLYFHIYNYNENNPELTHGITLCKACHLTQHITAAVERNWVKFVNSEYNQGTLVQQSRAQRLFEPLKSRSIVELPLTSKDFLEKIKNGEQVLTPTLKVVFTENFIFDDTI